MNSKVIQRMMKFKVTVHHTVSTNSLGDKTSEEFDVMGYLQESIKLVLNRLGRQETSGAQVYLTGEDIIKIDTDDRIDVSIPVKVPIEEPSEEPEEPDEEESDETEDPEPDLDSEDIPEGISEEDEEDEDETTDPDEGDEDNEEEGEGDEPEPEPEPEGPPQPQYTIEYKTIFSDKPILKKDVFYRPQGIPDVGVLYLP